MWLYKFFMCTFAKQRKIEISGALLVQSCPLYIKPRSTKNNSEVNSNHAMNSILRGTGGFEIRFTSFGANEGQQV